MFFLTKYILKRTGEKDNFAIFAYKRRKMNASRNRRLTKRYPKRLEGEILFFRYMKSFLNEMKISC